MVDIGGGVNPNNISCPASSPDGVNWTEASQIGPGSVPGLVKDANGVLHVDVS